MSEEFTKPIFVLTDVDNVPEGSKVHMPALGV